MTRIPTRLSVALAITALAGVLFLLTRSAGAVAPTSLPMPTSTGTGTAVDVSGFAATKTITYVGGQAGDVTAIEVSSDKTHWYQLGSSGVLTGGGITGATWTLANSTYAKWLRLDRLAVDSGGSVTATAIVTGSVAPTPYVNSTMTFTYTTSTTSSASTVSAAGGVMTVYYVGGNSSDYTLIEGTKDGSTWYTLLPEPGAQWITNVPGGNLQVRLERSVIGSSSATPTAFVMATGQGSGGLTIESVTGTTAGTPNGARVNFSLTRVPSTTSTLMLFASYPGAATSTSVTAGLLMSQAGDYTIAAASTTCVFAIAPATSTVITAIYW